MDYSVTLLDISRENLKLARQRASEAQVSLADVIHANAVDLSKHGSASLRCRPLDGPLYHLLPRGERVQAIQRGNACSQTKRKTVRCVHHAFAPFRYVAIESQPGW